MKKTRLPKFTIPPLLMMLMLLVVAPMTLAQSKSPDWTPFEDALMMGNDLQKPIVVDVWAPWCGWCKKMQKEVYPTLSEQLSAPFVWTRLNRDDHDSNLQFNDRKLSPFQVAQTLNVQQVPSIVFLSHDGTYLFHLSGFIEAEVLENLLKEVISKSLQEDPSHTLSQQGE